MFCPKCGSSNQTENSYCRNCGIFLPDFEKIRQQKTTPEQQILISSTFNILSALISLILTITLHIIYTGKAGTPIVIYVVIGFLTANFFWQAQAFWRIRQLKNEIPKKPDGKTTSKTSNEIKNQFSTANLLNQADLDHIVPESVTSNTTKELKQKVKLS